jgi:hypothetical protein
MKLVQKTYMAIVSQNGQFDLIFSVLSHFTESWTGSRIKLFVVISTEPRSPL